jgi:anti-anti-sigma factor
LFIFSLETIKNQKRYVFLEKRFNIILMNFKISHTNLYTLIVSSCEKLDINTSSELKSELVLLNKNGMNNIVLNLSKTLYCDSSGLSSILIANRLCKDTNGKFALLGISPKVLKLIQISQLDKVIQLFENNEEIENFFAN